MFPDRWKHLDLIRDRAALGKDFDRRDSFNVGSRSSSPYCSKPMSPYTKVPSPSPAKGGSHFPTAAAAAGFAGLGGAGGVGAGQEVVSRALAKSRKGLLPALGSNAAAGGGGSAAALSGVVPKGTNTISIGSGGSSKDTCTALKQEGGDADGTPPAAAAAVAAVLSAGQVSSATAGTAAAAASKVGPTGVSPAVPRLQSERPSTLQLSNKGRPSSTGTGVVGAGTGGGGGGNSSSSPGVDGGRGGLTSPVGWYGVGICQNESNKLKAARRRAAKFAKKMESCR